MTTDTQPVNPIELYQIHKDKIDVAMPFIETGLTHLRQRGDIDYSGYQLYHELTLEAAFLVMVTQKVEGSSAPVGFFVYSEASDHLFIWLAYSMPAQAEIIELVNEDIEVLAKSKGFNKIKYGTVRRGWEKLASKYGFKFEEARYVKHV